MILPPCRPCAALLLTVLLGQTARAEEEGPLPLSLEEAVERSLAHSPAYRLALFDVGRAEGGVVGARALLPQNPYFSFDIGVRDPPAGPFLSYALRLEQPIDFLGQRGARIRAAEAIVASSRLRTQALAAEVRARVRLGYLSVLIAQKREQFVARRVAQAEKTHAAARARAGAGAASEIEERLAEVELTRARLFLSDAAAAREHLEARLLAELDLSPRRPLRLTTPIPTPRPRGATLDQMLQTARERRKDLAALRAEGRAVDAAIERLRTERLPSIALTLVHERDSSFESWYAAGFSLYPTLWQRNQGPIAQATSDRARAGLAAEVLDRSIERDLAQWSHASERHRAEIRLFEEKLLPASARALELVQDGWRAGKFDIFRLVAISQDLINAELSYLESLGHLWTAEVELDRALGEENPR